MNIIRDQWKKKLRDGSSLNLEEINYSNEEPIYN